MIVAMVVAPYYVETITDKDTGTETVVTHRLSEATTLYNGRYRAWRDWLCLVPEEIIPDHGLATSAVWFDDSAEHLAALAEIRDKYAVVLEEEVKDVGQIPEWPK